MSYRLVFFSDSHNKHNKIEIPEGDFLFFTGDLSGRGKLEDLKKFVKFYASQSHRHKVMIAGNHDFCFENELRSEAEKIVTDAGIIYLNDSGIELEGLKIWGSPIQPWFHNWAFNRYPGEDILKHWNLIPNDLDVLLTHGPPYGIMDRTAHGELVGCPDLLKKVQELKPKIHAFGHIHEAYGMEERGETVFINASNLDHEYQYAHPAVLLEYRQ